MTWVFPKTCCYRQWRAGPKHAWPACEHGPALSWAAQPLHAASPIPGLSWAACGLCPGGGHVWPSASEGFCLSVLQR